MAQHKKQRSWLKHSLKAAALGTALFVSALTPAQAYQITTPYQSGHFALHQVILESYELFDSELQNSISRDLQVQNRMHKLYQSSAAIFAPGSAGLKGTIGESMLGLISISNYATGEDRIDFVKGNTASYAGLYFSFDQLKDYIDKKALNTLFDELIRLPLVITDIPVDAVGFDSRGSFYITGRNNALILDLRADDSVYYDKPAIQALRPGQCKLDALVFVERLSQQIPMLLNARGAVNAIVCADSGQDLAEKAFTPAAPASSTADSAAALSEVQPPSELERLNSIFDSPQDSTYRSTDPGTLEISFD